MEVKAMNKTISFAAVHFTVAFTVGYAMTGSVLVGGAIALVEPFINTFAYHIHEQVWNRIQAAKQNMPSHYAKQF
jgi:uncharacterized membrane protein